MISNDSILPISHFIIDNVICTRVNQFVYILSWSCAKLCLYFGFALLYIASFEKKRVGILFKILLAFVFIGSVGFFLVYLIDEFSMASSYEIVVTETFNFNFMNVYPQDSFTISLMALIGLVSDLLYIVHLIYCFVREARRRGEAKHRVIAIKATVLLNCSCLAYCGLMATYTLAGKAGWLIDNVPLLVDSVCLFLMFSENEQIY